MKTKVALISETLNTHSGARAPIDIAKNLAISGHKVILFAYNYNRDYTTLQDLKKHHVSTVVITNPKIPLIARYLTIHSLYRRLKEAEPKVILFAGTLPSFLAAKATHIPIVRIYMGTQLDAYLEKVRPGKLSFFAKVLNTIANYYILANNFVSFRLSSKIVAISQYAAKEGKRLYGRSADKVIYLSSSLAKSDQPDRQSPERSRRGDGASQINILSVSRITPYKGFHLVIESLKKIKTSKKITFTIIGSQPKKDYLNYLKQNGGELVNIIIDPDDKTLIYNYKNCDFYVTCDKNLYFGLPICEAAQFKKPTVAMNFAAAKELIMHGKTGYIAKNQDELTNCLEKLLKSPKLTDKLGEEAKKFTSKKFDWKIIAKNYNDLIQKII